MYPQTHLQNIRIYPHHLSTYVAWSKNSVPLDEFLSCIKTALTIGRWKEADRLRVVILRLADPAKALYNLCLELQAPDTTWQSFENVFKESFKDSHTDQNLFMQSQTAKQQKGLSPETFADRCCMLAPKIICRTVIRSPNASTERTRNGCV